MDSGSGRSRIGQAAPVSPAEVLARAGGRAESAALLDHVSRHQIRRAVDRGEIVRIARGVYALPGLSAGPLAAARVGGALCLEAAAVAWELPVLGTPPVTVAVRRKERPIAQPGVTYRWCDLSDEEVAERRTGLRRTILDCAAALPFPRALAVADSTLRDGHYPREWLVQTAEELRGPGRTRRLAVLRAADGRAENPFESAVRGVLLGAGIVGFEPQVLIRAPGFDAQVDLAHRRRRVVIEADGFAFHAATPGAFTRDVRRYDELVRSGWRVLRFTWPQVMGQPGWVVDVVRETLGHATTSAQVRPLAPRPATTRRRT